jgi:hypothetical protein
VEVSWEELDRIAYNVFGENVEKITSKYNTLRKVVFDMMGEAERQGKLEGLMQAVGEAK